MGDYIYSFPKNDTRNWGGVEPPKHGDVINLYSMMRDYLRPIRHKVVACLSGNHDDDWRKAENIDFVNWMCAELGMPYVERECYIRFKITVKDSENRRNIDVVLWHGDGGGRTIGGAANKSRSPIEVFRTPHIMAMGHTHRLGMFHEQWQDIDEDKLDTVATDQYFIMTGGYQKGYDPPHSTYISRKMLAPISIGGVKLEIQPFKCVGESDKLNVNFTEIR